MPGFLLHMGATVLCAHGGPALPTVPNPRVLVGGQPTALLSAPWTVAGCAFPPVSGGPCVTAQWVMGTVRVTSNGQPLVIMGGAAVCVPSGTPLMPVMSQMRQP